MSNPKRVAFLIRKLVEECQKAADPRAEAAVIINQIEYRVRDAKTDVVTPKPAPTITPDDGQRLLVTKPDPAIDYSRADAFERLRRVQSDLKSLLTMRAYYVTTLERTLTKNEQSDYIKHLVLWSKNEDEIERLLAEQMSINDLLRSKYGQSVG